MPGQATARRSARGHVHAVGEAVEGDHEGAQGVVAVGAAGPDQQPQVDLRRRGEGQAVHASSAARAA